MPSAQYNPAVNGKAAVKKGPQYFAVDRKLLKKDQPSGLLPQERTEKDWQALVRWYNSKDTEIKKSNLLLAYDVLVHLYKKLKAKLAVKEKECDSLSAQVKENEEEIKKLKEELSIARMEQQEALDSLRAIYNVVKPENPPVKADFNNIFVLECLIMDYISARQRGYEVVLDQQKQKFTELEKIHQALAETNKRMESLKNQYKMALVALKKQLRDSKLHQELFTQFLNGYEL